MADFIKAPSELLDYTLNWEDYLNERAETITDSVFALIEPAHGLSIASDGNTETLTTVWLSGGTLNKTVRVKNTITTSGGRTAVRTKVWDIKER